MTRTRSAGVRVNRRAVAGTVVHLLAVHGVPRARTALGTSFTSATPATVDGAGSVASFTSIAIEADGLGLIGDLDGTNGDPRVAHGANSLCSPFVVRRR